MPIYGSESREKKTVWKETSAPKPRLEPQGLLDDGICDHHRRGSTLCRSLVYEHVGWRRPDPVGPGKKVREMIQGRLPEGDIPPGNTSGIGDPIGGIRVRAVLLMPVSPGVGRFQRIRHDSGCARKQAAHLLPAPGARREIQHPDGNSSALIPSGVRRRRLAFRLVEQNERLCGLRTNPEGCRPCRKRDAGFSHIG